MKCLKISFFLNTAVQTNGEKPIEIGFDGKELTVSLWYSYSPNPLVLRAEAKAGDGVELILLPYRAELWVGGGLADEEWPEGELLFRAGDKIDAGTEVFCEVIDYERSAEPAVLGSFSGGEGWYPGGGVYVGDCMPYFRDGEYHLLYLKDRHHHKSMWGLGAHQWAHISTSDFENWNIHPMAVEITDPTEGSVCTGSWIRCGEKEYLYYTIRMGNGIPASIRRSVSADGYHFEKDTEFGFTVPDIYHAESARDPKVVRDEESVFHMFVTTSLLSENRGCLAHFVSRDNENWEDTGKPIYVSKNSDQPECPDWFFYCGKYYLVFSLCGKAHYMISDSLFEGFWEPEDSVIPCASVPKCARWGDRLVFAGFNGINGYGGSVTFKAARAASDGRLVFEEL